MGAPTFARMEDIHDNIRSIRIQKSYSQEHMAESLGISQSSYGKLERGKTKITYEKLLALAKTLDTSIVQIILHKMKPSDDTRHIVRPELFESDTAAQELRNAYNTLREQYVHMEELTKLLQRQVQDKEEIITLLRDRT